MQRGIEQTLRNTSDYDPWKALFLPIWNKTKQRLPAEHLSETSLLLDFTLLKHLLNEILDGCDNTILFRVRVTYFFSKIDALYYVESILSWQRFLAFFIDTMITDSYQPVSLGPLKRLVVLPHHMANSMQEFRQQMMDKVLPQWQWDAFDGSITMRSIQAWCTKHWYTATPSCWDPVLPNLMKVLEEMNLDLYAYCGFLQILKRKTDDYTLTKEIQKIMDHELQHSIFNLKEWECLSDDGTIGLFYHRNLPHPDHFVSCPLKIKEKTYCEVAKFWCSDL